jgi:hypothetical protein
MSGRILKQLLYIITFILIVGAIFFAFYWRHFFPAATCSDGIQNQTEEGIDCGVICGISCEQKYLKDLSYSTPQVFTLGDYSSVYFDVTNPNPNFGLTNFKYQIDFIGFADKVLQTVNGESFVYPGESKRIMEAGQKVLGEISSVRVSFFGVNWQPASAFRSIRLENIGTKTARQGDFFVVSGTVKNLNSFTISQIVINAFLLDKDNNILGISKTKLEQLPAFEQMNYSVFIEVNPAVQGKIDFNNSTTSIYTIY